MEVAPMNLKLPTQFDDGEMSSKKVAADLDCSK